MVKKTPRQIAAIKKAKGSNKQIAFNLKESELTKKESQQFLKLIKDGYSKRQALDIVYVRNRMEGYFDSNPPN